MRLLPRSTPRALLAGLLLLSAAGAAATGAQPAPATTAASAPTASAGTVDTLGLVADVARARHALRGMPALWKVPADSIGWVFVGQGRAFATVAHAGGDSLAPIVLPTGTSLANQSVSLEGRKRAMILLPLRGSADERLRLLVHEATHTLQPERLPHPGNTEPAEGGDLLDTGEARTWLFLELRALARALTTRGSERQEAARDALAFRAARDRLALPRERARLDALDLAEGIPEYTAWRLSGSPVDTLAQRLARASSERTSWVRGVGYVTTPAYGLLLDALAVTNWRAAFRGGELLPSILARALGPTDTTSDLRVRVERHGGGAIEAAERSRTMAREHRLDSLRTRFVSGASLRLVPGALRISFDPNGQYPLGDDGTIMTNLRWAGADGAELVAPTGALVSPAWDFIQVPLGDAHLPDGTLAAPQVVESEGWKLTLPAGWRVTRRPGGVEVRPPA